LGFRIDNVSLLNIIVRFCYEVVVLIIPIMRVNFMNDPFTRVVFYYLEFFCIKKFLNVFII
jgi:hypothetical protein